MTHSLLQVTWSLIWYCFWVAVLLKYFVSVSFGHSTLHLLHLKHPGSGTAVLPHPAPSLQPPIILWRFGGCLVQIWTLFPISLAWSFFSRCFFEYLSHWCIGGLVELCVNTCLTLPSVPFFFLFYIYMTQIRDDSTFTSFGVTKKLKYIDHNFFAFQARDLNLTFSENSAITNL